MTIHPASGPLRPDQGARPRRTHADGRSDATGFGEIFADIVRVCEPGDGGVGPSIQLRSEPHGVSFWVSAGEGKGAIGIEAGPQMEPRLMILPGDAPGWPTLAVSGEYVQANQPGGRGPIQIPLRVILERLLAMFGPPPEIPLEDGSS